MGAAHADDVWAVCVASLHGGGARGASRKFVASIRIQRNEDATMAVRQRAAEVHGLIPQTFKRSVSDAANARASECQRARARCVTWKRATRRRSMDIPAEMCELHSVVRGAAHARAAEALLVAAMIGESGPTTRGGPWPTMRLSSAARRIVGELRDMVKNVIGQDEAREKVLEYVMGLHPNNALRKHVRVQAYHAVAGMGLTPGLVKFEWAARRGTWLDMGYVSMCARGAG